jgi:hypothetical protein
MKQKQHDVAVKSVKHVCALAALQYHSHTWEHYQQGSWERSHLAWSVHYTIYNAAPGHYFVEIRTFLADTINLT